MLEQINMSQNWKMSFFIKIQSMWRKNEKVMKSTINWEWETYKEEEEIKKKFIESEDPNVGKCVRLESKA
jgi:hypothetical protein